MHVVIIGFDRREHARGEKRLFSYDTVKGEPEETTHNVLSPYLFDASLLGDPHTVVARISASLNTLPDLRFGTQPIDGGNLIVDADEYHYLCEKYAQFVNFAHPFVGSREYLQGGERYILSIQDANPSILRSMPEVLKKIQQVKDFRLESKRKVTRDLADFPTSFAFTTIPESDFLVIPEVSSERRDYVPIGWLAPPTIPSNLVRVALDVTRPDFALLTSSMHMAWLRNIGGRLKSDYRYSIGLVYNTFPLPVGKDLSKLEKFGQAILDARANHPDATLADLYDPDVMPADLRRAHMANDAAVDALYKRGGFKSERERVEHLFMLYEQQTAGMLAKPKKRRR